MGTLESHIRTIRIVGVDVGIGGAPALDESNSTAAVALLTIATHYHTQHRTSVTPNRPMHGNDTAITNSDSTTEPTNT